MSDSESQNEPGPSTPPIKQRRSRFKSYNDTLKEVHLPSTLSSTNLDFDVEENDSQFHSMLEHWHGICVQPSFLGFHRKMEPKCRSTALLLHNWEEIVDLWCTTLPTAEEDALEPLIDLMQALSHDLRTTILPSYPTLLSSLLSIFPQHKSTSTVKYKLSPKTLTTLLKTLSSLFRYVLLPSPQLLQPTWTLLRRTMISIIKRQGSGVSGEEMERMLAEVWGGFLRRLRDPKDAVRLLGEGLGECQDGVAWTICFAVQAASGSIHPAGPKLLALVMEEYLSASETAAGPLFRLLRRTLVSAAQHTTSAKQFEPVMQLLLDLYKRETESGGRVSRLQQLLSVACSVKKGARLTAKQVSSILTLTCTAAPPSSASDHITLLELTSSALVAGDMTVWMGPGKSTLTYVFSISPILGLRLAMILSELDWPGWKVVVLPLLGSKQVLDLLEDSEAFALIQYLVDQGRIDKDLLGNWAAGKLAKGGWDRSSPNDVLDLTALLTASNQDAVTPAQSVVEDILVSTQDGAASRSDFYARSTNSTWVLGRCLKALSAVDCDAAASWAEQILEKWNWNAPVLEGLLKLMEKVSNPSVPFATALRHLRPSLISPYQPLRLISLRILSHLSTDTYRPFLDKLVAAESIPISFDSFKERVNRINVSLPTPSSELEFEIIALWLLAQLKVNLKPLWVPSINALAGLVKAWPAKGWDVVFEEIKMASREDREGLGEIAPEWSGHGHGGNVGMGEVEQEKSWIDPYRKQVIEVLDRFGCGPEKLRSYQLSEVVKAQVPARKLDVSNYEAQLLALLAAVSHVSERNNHAITSHFLSENSPPMRRSRLSLYLTVFSKFKRPSQGPNADTLHRLYTSLLSEPDRPLQRLALECLLSYSSPALKAQHKHLAALVDDKEWRAGVATWDPDQVPEHERDEVVPTSIRLMYGLLLNRKGKKKSSAERKTAILSTIGRARDNEVCSVLVGLMLDRLGQNGTAAQKSGFVLLLGDVMRILGPKLQERWADLFMAAVEVAGSAQADISSAMDVDEPNDEDDAVQDGEASEDGGEDEDLPEQATLHPSRPRYNTKPARVLRKVAFKRVESFFSSSTPFDFSPHMQRCFQILITPRLSSLHRENLSAIGTFLPLLVTWSRRSEYIAFLQDYEPRLLPTVFDCLGLPNVGSAVARPIFDIIENLLKFSSAGYGDAERVFQANVACVLRNLFALVQRSNLLGASDAAVNRQVEVLALLAPHIQDKTQASQIFEMLLPPLKRNAKAVPEPMKAHLLTILGNLVSLVPYEAVIQQAFDNLSGLLANLRSREARDALLSVFRAMKELDASFETTYGLLLDLNSFTERKDEPDVDCRLDAFARLNEKLYLQLTPQQWTPVISNVFFIARDTSIEFPLRNAATLAIRRLIERCDQPEIVKLFGDKVYPGLLRILEVGSEDAKRETLTTLSYAAEKDVQHDWVSNLKMLQNDGREEDVLLNLYSVQRPQQLKALRVLGEKCEKGLLRSKTLADIFIPVLTSFMHTSSNQPLVDEAVANLTKVAGCLEWGPYHNLFRRHMNATKVGSENRRIHIRAAVAILNGFHFPLQNTSEDVVKSLPVDEGVTQPDDQMEVDGDLQQKIFTAVQARILPEILRFVEIRDETEDRARIPMALGIIRIAQHLPDGSRRAQISRLLTILSQSFRSKSIETRNLARDTLLKIMSIVGWDWLPRLIKELRLALTRGPQLHILATAVYVLLKHVTNEENSIESLGNLDGCVEDAAHIAAEVVFGESAANVNADGFHSSVKEVSGSSNRGQETFLILAKHVSPTKISKVLEPVRAIMHETSSLRMMNLVDQVLSRVAQGLEANPRLSPADILSLSYALVSQNAKFLKQAPSSKRRKVRKDVSVDLKVQRAPETISNHYAATSYKFVAFGLDIFLAATKKGKFAKHNIELLSRLEPFVPLILGTLSSSQVKVLTFGLRASAAIVRYPLQNVSKELPQLVQQILAIIEQAGNTESEVVQTALKTLSSMLRDYPSLELPEEDLRFLLKTVAPDVEEPSRQETVFAFLRSVMLRKFMAPEIYDLMDKIAETMVTSQYPKVQTMARDVYLVFVTEYPQGKARMKVTMEFIARNLSYVYEPGRKSVMELLSKVLENFKADLVNQYADLFFMALVMVLANDESSKCREMGGVLLASLLERMNNSRRSASVDRLRKWAAQSEKPGLRRVAVQIHGISLGIPAFANDSHVDAVVQDVEVVLRDVYQAWQRHGDPTADQAHFEEEWQLVHQAFTTLIKALRSSPDMLQLCERLPWNAILAFVTYPHAWVKLATVRVQGLLYTATPVAAPDSATTDHPMSAPRLLDAVRGLSEYLKSASLDATAALQIVKNLLYIGRTFYQLTIDHQEDIMVQELDQQGEESEEESSDATGIIRRPNLTARNPLGWMYLLLSRQLRTALHQRQVARDSPVNWAEQPSAIIRWFAAMTTQVDQEFTELWLPAVVRPLSRLLAMQITGDAQFDDLKSLALELQDLLQNKVGGTKYTYAYSNAIGKANEEKERRKTKDVAHAIRDPDAAGRRKQHQQAMKHEARKRKARDALKGRDTKKYKGW